MSPCLRLTAALLLFALVAGFVVAQEPPATGGARPTPGRGGERGARARREGRGRGREEKSKPKRDKPGIAVDSSLMEKHCIGCHKKNDKGHMTRISYVRKGPEGWQITLKRMIRNHDLKFSPDEAKRMIRYLSNQHGLAREEAERGLYEAERRVHWSEAEHDADIKRACAPCHTLGRVFSQQRDAEEWQLLKLTHMALYPMSTRQFGERSDSGRGRGGGSRGGGGSGRSTRGGGSERSAPGRGGSGESSRGGSGRGGSSGGGSRADRVLAKLAKDQPLFSDEWKEWQVDEREVPMEGIWSIVGHEVSRGDVRGRVIVRRVERDAYETEWRLEYGDGARVVRHGRAVMYAGYSWRGRTKGGRGTPKTEPEELREVLLLSDDWNRMKGRLFTGGYNELGMDVELHRHTGAPRVFTVDGPVQTPASDAEVVVRGESFARDVKPADFHLGKKVSVKVAKWVSPEMVKLVVDVEKGAELGKRRVSYRASRGPKCLTVYDTIDYIKVAPTEGLSRVGGVKYPKQLERFEAIAMHRGPDKKLYTKDDWPIKVVPAKWRLEEFHVRENDDDLAYVGALVRDTGVFTPEREGPNVNRRWKANNIGDVYVVAEAKLTVAKRPPEPKKKPAPEKKPEGANGGGHGGPTAPSTDRDPAVEYVEKEFKARGHLLVTVPLYIRWDLTGFKAK